MADAKQFKYTDHPCITLLGKKPFLRIFEDFFIEEKLPKFKSEKVESVDSESKSLPNNLVDSNENDPTEEELRARDMASIAFASRGLIDGRVRLSTPNSVRWDRDRYVSNKARDMTRSVKKTEEKTDVLKKMKSIFKRKTASEPEVSAVDTFRDMKITFMRPTTELLERSKLVVDSALDRLNAIGQYEKAKDMEQYSKVIAMEIALAKDGRFSKYLTEDQVVKFMIKSEKGVDIEYLRFYGDMLPTEVGDLKIEADKLLIFDNYAVIYFNPDIAKFEQSNAAVAAARIAYHDPILVGLIQGSRKLYYITDWVTDDDDLTLSKLEEAIGQKAHQFGILENEIKTTDDIARELNNMIDNIKAAEDSVDDSEDL